MFDAELNARDGKGIALRVHLERAAEQGRESAIKRLQGPVCPEALRYMRTLLYRLHGKSGVGMNGAVPLTYSTVFDFMHVTDTPLDPWEVDLLMDADVVLITASST